MAYTSARCLTGEHHRCLVLDCACSVCNHRSPRPTGQLAPSTSRRAAYSRAYRAAHPDAAEQNRLANQARGKALRRLANQFPEEFQALYDQERAEVGLSPLGAVLPGRKPTG